MTRYLTAQPVEEVPQTESVSDFDELGDDQQQAVADLVCGEDGDCRVEESLDGAVVRFTDYYRIQAAGMRASD
jgi:hypothetical protein